MNNLCIKYLPSKYLVLYIVTIPLSYLNTLLPTIAIVVGAWIASNDISISMLGGIILLFLGGYTLLGGMAFWNQKMKNAAISNAAKRLREDLVTAMLQKRSVVMDQSVLLNDVGKIEEEFYPASIDLVEQVGMYVIAFGMMFVQSPVLTIYISLFSILLALLGRKERQSGMSLQQENSLRQSEMLEFLENTKRGYDTVLIYGLQKNMTAAFRKLSSDLSRVQEKVQWKQNKTNIMVMAFLVMLSLTSVLMGNIFIARETLSAAQLLAIISLTNNLFKPFQCVMSDLYQVVSIRKVEQKLLGLLAKEQDCTYGITESDKEKKAAVSVMKEGFELNLPSLMIQEKEILHGIHMDVHPGEKILLLGANGSGKSTLLKYILGQFGIEKNRCFMDGIDVSNLSEEERYAYFALINADCFLIPGTVIDNIDCCRPVSHEVIQEAWKLAELYELNENKNAQILSGGQKQKTAIARAIVSGKKFLLWDEAFSAVDAESRHNIEKKLLCSKELTIIAVEHRMSKENYFYFDKVILLENGTIYRMGTPAELQEENFVLELLEDDFK